MDTITEGMIWYFAFIMSTTMHEAAHAFTAMKLGDRTAYLGGQVSLDPLPHIRREPVGMVVMPVLSFFSGGWMIGWASTPYDAHWARRYPKRSALMSLAGPAANLSLVLLAAVAIRIGMAYSAFEAPDTVNALHVTVAPNGGMLASAAVFLSVMFTLNVVLFVFNMLPLPPLDGSGALPLILGEGTSGLFMERLRHPGFAIFGLIVAWQVFGVVYRPIRLFALNMLYPGLSYH
ncbi:MAG: hypothetical protein A2X56_14475 [Nitrospirae bacterium GWC2_57_13]|nr:MAG: hypothetical protein A2X56_14475 [Nitrospirae bacterium GWC2_57_13]